MKSASACAQTNVCSYQFDIERSPGSARASVQSRVGYPSQVHKVLKQIEHSVNKCVISMPCSHLAQVMSNSPSPLLVGHYNVSELNPK